MKGAWPVRGSSLLRAIFWGGLVAGILDLAFALAFNGLRGTPLIKIPQVIASGLLGPSSFQGGLATAAAGVALHFVIAYACAASYNLAARFLRVLIEQPVRFGLLYGAAVFGFMRLVVLPLSHAPRFKPSLVPILSDLGSHLFFVGLTIALIARHYGREAWRVTGDAA